MSTDYAKILSSLEAGVREGRAAPVKRELLVLNSARVPRELRLPFASLGRRVGLNNFGLRLLTPLVRDSHPTPDELAEYAVLLQRTGSLDEAFKILRSLDLSRVPVARLYLAFCHFNRWEYYESLPLLRDYVRADLPAYRRTVGEVNLAAALVAAGEYNEAIDLLKVIEANAKEQGLRRLEGNAHEIRAQALFHLGELNTASTELELAHALLKTEGTVAELNVNKWRAVVRAFTDQNAEPLQKFRAEALAFRDWEAVRHADLCLLQLKFSSPLFEYHLFGSPWIAYREKAQRTLGRVISLESYAWGREGGAQLDAARALFNGEPIAPLGGKLHRALFALTTDFYRPLPVGALFAQLFPGEHFDIFSSPNRVHQTLFRLRNWVAKLPLEILRSKEGYALKVTGPISIIVPYERRAPDSHFEMFKVLSSTLTSPRSLKEIAAEAHCGISTARKFCSWALDKGYLTKSGAGPATRYHLASQIKTA